MYCYMQKRDKYNVLLYEQWHGSKAERKSYPPPRALF